MIDKNNITAVILSGGRSSRMQGEDKGLILLNDKPLISYVADVVNSKVVRLLISANRNIDAYQKYGEVISDELSDFQGPLAGIVKAMSVVSTPYLLVLPCDSPLVNEIVIDRLIQCMTDKDMDICVAGDGVRIHPTFALIKTSLKDNLLDFLDSGERKLGLWIEQNDFQKVDFSDQPKVFINLNNPQDFDKI
ncbi:MAG TPA: molybdenum cofactor guanylyltransferase [Gammaproteobacteria bacterium]|jgi:molybdopterin-guanine dinucleotide biosynthesis protein A|nr:molybdenum cofactor guanylyltransferase [Gammaproteobacteria bacterium]HAE04542.1 molybdenum cofactor guanylyltransferase [Gammaproteobacteria bacterium]HAE72826.1 molybdenum cofactor guanylyltransferase [Gammaproteobacteria bacterium]HAG47445.1 molybdenum cofactor guanylyltransferase [Gammaproteobacteria bacterium]HAN33126.1 molybdenum cofactor guanylyltransferase [Gammaproteobacteria bacterium]